MNTVLIDRVFFVFLAIFLLLTGLAAVSTVRFDFMLTIAGFCALIAGVIGVVRAFR